MITVDQLNAVEKAANRGHAVSEILLSHICNPESDALSEDVLINLVETIAHQLHDIRASLKEQDDAAA